jgi:hypothetical protein
MGNRKGNAGREQNVIHGRYRDIQNIFLEGTCWMMGPMGKGSDGSKINRRHAGFGWDLMGWMEAGLTDEV